MSRDESKYKKRGPGRPVWTNYYDTKVDTRITAKDSNALDRLAEQYGVTRSQIVRKALRDFIVFNEGDNRKENNTDDK